MALLLSGQSLTKSFGQRPLFVEISLDLQDGERVGLIGPNGSGKSTLLKILAGLEQPDTGIRSLRRAAQLGYVEQEDVFPKGYSVRQVLLEVLADSHWDSHERDTKVEIALGKVGFDDLEQITDTLSGGWRKRLAIARQLVLDPDVLLLDEPTNHLDLEGIIWLEKLLTSAQFAVLLVSHDRYFLENVARRVVEINRVYPKGFFGVDGKYSDFIAAREVLLAGQIEQQNVLAGKVRREIEWLRRGPAARTTKSVSRIKNAGKLMDNLAEVSFRNAQTRPVEMEFTASGRKGNKLLVAENIEKKLGSRLLYSKLDFILSPGTKVGLLGPNGSGKTTLLKTLTGEIQPDSGKIERAYGLRTVLFDQARRQLDKDQTLRTALAHNEDHVVYNDRKVHVVAWAKRFLFREEQLVLPVSSLSGGEQARILIARLMLQAADLLILDEPTNDLDIPSLEVLEESLTEFPGAIVLVTHDRYLLDRVSNVILALDGQGGSKTYADLAQWQSAQQMQPPPGKAKSSADTKGAAAKGRNKQEKEEIKRLTYQEQRELEQMEAKILACEERIEQQNAALEDPAVTGDHAKLCAACERLEAAQQEAARLYARWQELEGRRIQTA